MPVPSIDFTRRFTCPQGVNSATFVAPPVDGSLNLHQLFDFNSEHSPDHPLYVYESQQGAVKTMTWGEAANGFHRATKLAISILPRSDLTSSPIVGIFGNSGKVTAPPIYW